METIDIHRHRTAITRTKLSSPMQSLFKYGYLDGDFSILDYGCGRGDDFRELKAKGLDVAAWDPVHYAEGEKKSAHVVNLGFVINVIENPQERISVLREAFQYAEKLLVVAVMLQERNSEVSKWRSFNDGVLTQRRTFQKYYSQTEFKEYLERTLKNEAIPVAPGIVFIFKDKQEEQEFLAERYYRRAERIYQYSLTRDSVVRPLTRSKIFQQNLPAFENYWHDCLSFGRPPLADEVQSAEQVISLVGSPKKAFDLCSAHWGTETLDAARQARRNDLLVYLALNLFKQRKATKNLPERLTRDMKAFFSNSQTAQQEAHSTLFSIGKPFEIEKACILDQERLGFGIIEHGHSFTIHTSYLSLLSPILRMYIGAAATLFGDVSQADLIKIHMNSGKLTLLFFDNFTDQCLPNLLQRIKIKMREQDFDIFEYGNELYKSQPLYQKSNYIGKDFERYDEQLEFDKQLIETGIDFSGYGPEKEALTEHLQKIGLEVRDFQIQKI